MKFKIFKFFFKLGLYSCILGFLLVLGVVAYYSISLPDYKKLGSYSSPVTTRLYAENGNLIEEYAKEKRSFTPIKFIPEHIKQAFLAAEDSNFYQHPGIDVKSIIRAMIQNVLRYKSGKNFIGASTITQQVVKNILLTNERKISRKIKEAILAINISKSLSKDRILELYLNEIYLGNHSYGVTSAALNYFDKSLDDLTIEEAAFLAALPKSPSSLNPHKYYDRALERRNWVIKRMKQEGFIDSIQAEYSKTTPIVLHGKRNNRILAGSFSEEVRKIVAKEFGDTALEEQGLVIEGTLKPNYQKIAFKALRKGLQDYHIRNAYKGPISKITIQKKQENLEEQFVELLKNVKDPSEVLYEKWQLAVVFNIDKKEESVEILFKDGAKGIISMEHLGYLKKEIEKENPDKREVEKYLVKFNNITEIFSKGDVILAQQKFIKGNKIKNHYILRTTTKVSGAVVAMNPHNGNIIAMVGGYTDKQTEFNRAVQAKRQPGSIIKPFTYLTALANGFTPNTIVIDDEVKMKKEDGSYWVPMNYSQKFYGPTPIRMGLEKSRNVVTVRLAEIIGLHNIAEIVKKFGIIDEPVSNFSLVLGSDETTLLRVVTAYSMIANGGKRIEPNFIEKIQDREGKTIFSSNKSKCEQCNYDENVKAKDIKLIELFEEKEQIVDERTVYQMTSLLQGVVQRGTGWRAKRLIQPIAGKTGTTNDSFDAWFVGFSPDLVIGVWVGFDTPKTLGKHETGSGTAAPIFVNIMKQVQKKLQKSHRDFKIPSGLKFVKIDGSTGQLPNPSSLQKNIIFEIFKEENFEKAFNQGQEFDEEGEVIEEGTNLF